MSDISLSIWDKRRGKKEGGKGGRGEKKEGKNKDHCEIEPMIFSFKPTYANGCSRSDVLVISFLLKSNARILYTNTHLF